MTANKRWDSFVVVNKIGDTMTAYQNGTLDFVATGLGLTGTSWQNNGVNLWFGNDPGGNTDYDGIFTKIEFWGRDLSKDEVDYLTANPYANYVSGSKWWSLPRTAGHGPPASKSGHLRSPILASRQIIGSR